jgi:hypothetical protein
MLRYRVPTLPGWADVWRAGPTGLELAVLSFLGSHPDTLAPDLPLATYQELGSNIKNYLYGG